MHGEDQDRFDDFISDRYRLIKKLGSGSFSTVYKAAQTATDQDVAVKILRFINNESNEEKARQIERFRREMLICGKLYHPSIVKVLDFGQTPEGVIFSVFEYIPGVTLSSLVEKEGALTVKRTLAIMLQVLEGLRVAHEQGIIHRDLKPENIMVATIGKTEQAKILDFGISTFSTDRNIEFNRLTMTKEFLGTPVYSAPEQLRGSRVTFKCDLYSWGLVFLKCILGYHPYGQVSVADVVQKQLSSNPVPVPPELEEHPLGELLHWVLEKKSARRTGDAAHLIARIQQIPSESMDTLDVYVGSSSFSTIPPLSQANETKGIKPGKKRTVVRRRVTCLCVTFDFVHNDILSNSAAIDEIYFDIRKSCASIVSGLNGAFLGECGGQLLFVFGYPHSNETDIPLAGSAALKLAEALIRFNLQSKQKNSTGIVHRIGLHVGEMSDYRRWNEAPTGVVFWMTRQLCSIAEGGEILATDSVVEVLKKEMDFSTIRQADLEGFYNIGKLYRIKGRRDILGSRFDSGRPKMFGRQHLLNTLLMYWMKSQDGDGVSILVKGDAGEGKTRLIAEFVKEVRGQSGGYLEIVCTPESQHSPLCPVFDYLRRLLCPCGSLPPEDSARYVEKSLQKRGVQQPEQIGLFCMWFGFEHPTCQSPRCSPQKQSALLLTAICDVLVSESKRTQSVILIEDLHWADNATLTFLDYLIVSVKQHGRCLLMSARNSFDPEWSEMDVEIFPLPPLDSMSIRSIVNAIDKYETLPGELRDTIVKKADGVPLFAEELTYAALDQADDELGADDALSMVKIPNNLKELLTRKLDRLTTAKKVAQLASVIGREFSYTVLSAICEGNERGLLSDLDALVSAGIIHANYYEGEFYYVFHHALMRDATYDSISPDDKTVIHGKLSSVLETKPAGFAKAHPDQLAVHFACAGNFQKAVFYSYLAAENSLTKSFYNETIIHARQAMAWAENLDNKVEINEAKLRLHQLLAPALTATKGYGSLELIDEVHKAEKWLAFIPESSTLRFPVLWGMIVCCHVRPDYNKLDRLLANAFEEVKKSGAVNDMSALYSIRGHRMYSKGELEAAESNLLQALKLYEPSNHAARYGHDTKIFAISTLALLYTVMGRIADAEDAVRDALQWGCEMESAQSTAMAMAYELGMWHYRNEPEIVSEKAEKLVRYAQAKDVANWDFVASLLGGWAKGSVADIEEGLSLLKKLGIGQLLSYWHFPLAQVHVSNGALQEAIQVLDAYIDQAIQSGERFYLPEFYRLKAKVLWVSEPSEKESGMSIATKAIDLAKSIGAKLFELRGYLELSRMMAQQVFLEKYGDDLNQLVLLMDCSLPMAELAEAKVLLSTRA